MGIKDLFKKKKKMSLVDEINAGLKSYDAVLDGYASDLYKQCMGHKKHILEAEVQLAKESEFVFTTNKEISEAIELDSGLSEANIIGIETHDKLKPNALKIHCAEATRIIGVADYLSHIEHIMNKCGSGYDMEDVVRRGLKPEIVEKASKDNGTYKGLFKTMKVIPPTAEEFRGFLNKLNIILSNIDADRPVYNENYALLDEKGALLERDFIAETPDYDRQAFLKIKESGKKTLLDQYMTGEKDKKKFGLDRALWVNQSIELFLECTKEMENPNGNRLMAARLRSELIADGHIAFDQLQRVYPGFRMSFLERDCIRWAKKDEIRDFVHDYLELSEYYWSKFPNTDVIFDEDGNIIRQEA